MPGIIEERAEAEFHVETSSGFINRIDLDRPNTDLRRDLDRPTEGIDQQHAAQTLTLYAAVNGKATDQNDGYIEPRQCPGLADWQGVEHDTMR